MKHKWRMSNGVPDEWAWESGFHNGVYCERCGKTVCVNCHPDWEEMDDCEKYESEPQTNADRMIAMIQNGQVRDLLDWWEEIFEDGVPGDDYFEWWLRQPVKDGDNG